MNRADFLAKVPVFSHLKKEDLERIAKQTRYHEFQEGDVIISEGERDNRLFIVTSGRVEVIKGLGKKTRGIWPPLASMVISVRWPL